MTGATTHAVRLAAAPAGPVLLVIETATTCGSVAVMAADACLAEFSLQSRLTHSRRLLAGIDFLLQETGIQWGQVDAVAVSLGPGSFTGLRIGLSTAKGLALAIDRPLLGVGTLDGLAAQFAFSGYQICPLLDARKQEVYTALYRCRDCGVPTRGSDLMVIAPDTLVHLITEPTIFLGDGLGCCANLLRDRLGDLALVPVAPVHVPRAAAVGRLALSLWQQQEFVDPASVVPIYVRSSDAELNFG